MSQQDQLIILQEQADDLIGYVRDYQQRLVEADFASVTANGQARRAEARLAATEEALRVAHARIEELEIPPVDTPPEEPDAPVQAADLPVEEAEPAAPPAKRK